MLLLGLEYGYSLNREEDFPILISVITKRCVKGVSPALSTMMSVLTPLMDIPDAHHAAVNYDTGVRH